MPTKPFVLPSVWDDPDFKALDGDQTRAWLWLVTNRGRDQCGYTHVIPERFTFDTRLHFGVLTGLIGSVSRSIASTEGVGSLHVVLLNFIRHQYVASATNAPKNPLHIGLCRDIIALKPELREKLLSRYADYPGLLAGVNQRLNANSPKAGAAQGIGEGTGTGAGMDKDYSPPTDQEIMAFINDWPGEPASGVPKFDRDWAFAWVARVMRRGDTEFPRFWQRAMTFDWRKDYRNLAGVGSIQSRAGAMFTVKTAGKKPSSVWELKQILESVRLRIDTHAANSESASYISDMVTPEEEQELADLLKQETELVRQISQHATAS